MVTRKEIGGLLKAARKKAGLTQEQVAAKFDVLQTSVSKWEVGHVDLTVAQLQKLAELYECTLADLTTLPPSSSDSGTHAAVDPAAAEPSDAAGNA